MNAQHLNKHNEHNEIALADLWFILVQRKMIIFTITIFATCLALLYLALAKPIYKTTSVLIPPTIEQVEPLITEDFDEGAESVFALFKENLESTHLRLQVFQDMNLIKALSLENFTSEAAFSEFNKSISYTIPKTKKGKQTSNKVNLSMQGHDPQLITDIINQLVYLTGEKTKQEAISNRKARIESHKKRLTTNIQLLKAFTEEQKQDEILHLKEADQLQIKMLTDEIRALRIQAKTKRLNRITQLKESLNIALDLGIIDNTSQQPKVSGQTSAIFTEINTQKQPIYMRGSKALQSEIKQLKYRKSDDPFIKTLVDLQNKKSQLRQNRTVEMLASRKNNDAYITSLRSQERKLSKLNLVLFHPDKISVMRIDQPAFAPRNPIKPKPVLVILLGLLLGLFIGMLTALFAHAIKPGISASPTSHLNQ